MEESRFPLQSPPQHWKKICRRPNPATYPGRTFGKFTSFPLSRNTDRVQCSGVAQAIARPK
jgi:hypothetical protein